MQKFMIALIMVMLPSLALAQNQATCYFNADGIHTGGDWGNQSNGNLQVGQSERQGYKGDYAFVFIVELKNEQFTCPEKLTIACGDCPPGQPVW